MSPLRLLAALAACCILLDAAAAPRVVAYYPFWASYNRGVALSATPVEQLTHLVYAYAALDEQGQIIPGDAFADTLRVETGPDGRTWQGNYRVLASLRERNPALKILLAVGGWDRSARFSGAFASPKQRQAFVQSFLQLRRDYGFDGLEIDWRFPVGGGAAGNPVSPQDWQSLRDTLAALRAACRECEFSITAGPHATQRQQADWPALLLYADFITLLVGDYRGPWTPETGHRSPLFAPSGQQAAIAPLVAKLHEAGIPPQRMVLQLSALAMSWEGVAADNHGIGQPASGASRGSWDRPDWPASGQIALADLPRLAALPGTQAYYDTASAADTLYLPGSSQFISYESPRSLQAKLDFASQHALGGIGLWDVSSDRSGSESLVAQSFRHYYPTTYWLQRSTNMASGLIPWLIGIILGAAGCLVGLWWLWRQRQQFRQQDEVRTVRRLQQQFRQLPEQLHATAVHAALLAQRFPDAPDTAQAALHQARHELQLLQAAMQPFAVPGIPLSGNDATATTALPAADDRQPDSWQQLAGFTRALQGQRSVEELLAVLQRFAAADPRVCESTLRQDDEDKDALADGLVVSDDRHTAQLSHPLLGDYTLALRFHAPLQPDAEAYFRQLAEQILLLRQQVQGLLRHQQLLGELFEVASRRDRLHFIEASRGYSGIHAADLREPHFITLRLRTLRQYFDDTVLLQVHRSYLVAPAAVTGAVKVRGGLALSVAGKLVPVARSQQMRIRQRYPQWFEAVSA
ncbi:glycosyl hydrolase family 18 protein [Chitinilyticum piscinae]|uniref:chitinase n=1 Tax=Chitinilyticum piscinae TaxID=2866724 RepID=A0A8J7K8T3_9NEIS|nr:glycosyl hydrolase family 18 protein [Chitinilyticum piscinae]MBE9610108.1 LytTR family transcriptional regulator DNA-binding domain-containing protein [Chitinilyticum piscinae]